MIDHMLVDLKKYYEGQAPNYIGRTIQRPKNDVALYDVLDSGMFISEAELLPGQTTRFTTDYKILGQVTVSNITYLALMIAYTEDTSTPHFRYARLNDILQNGGVSHSHLTHSYRAFHLVRKEISMALMKMKYQLKDWYQGITQNYIGRSVTLPKTKIRFYDIFDSTDVIPSGSYTDCQHGKILGNIGTVNGQFFVGNDTFLTISFPFEFDYDDVHTIWLKMSDILQNGGDIE